MAYLAFGAIYVVVYLATAAALGSWPVARTIACDGLLASLALAVSAVVIRRRHAWAGVQRLFWDIFTVSQILWAIGEFGFMYGELVDGRPSWVRWHTMFSLCGGIGPTIAVIARPDRGVRKQSTAAVAVDLSSYGLLAAFIYAYFVMVPSLVPSSREQVEATLLSLVRVHRLLLVGGFAAGFWLAKDLKWRSTYGRILAGTSAGFVLRLITNKAIANGMYYSGSVYDLAWIVPFIAYVWAASEAPPSPVESAETLGHAEAPSPILSAIPVLGIPVIGYSLLWLSPLGGGGDAFRILLTTICSVGGLALLILRMTVQSGELHRADERLKLLAAAVEQTGDLILITTPDARIEHANDAAVRALGYPRDVLPSMRLPDVLEESERDLVARIGTHVRMHGIWRGTLHHRRADGRTFPASSTVVALRAADGRVTHFVGVQRDSTEELRLRDQLVNSERLSAVGELVAGVAHEINNPLQTIIGCTELMLEEGRDTPLVPDLKLVRQEAARAGQIVRNLLAFVRRGSPDRKLLDLNDVVRSMAELREFHLAQRGIALALDLAPARLPVSANREEIQQIVINILLNGEHALEAAGPINPRITIVTRADGAMQMVQISDNGPGISSELKGRIFEPFFTTKDVGEGTGLGLSISLGIARAHGGSLELCDPPDGRGACFRLTLPAVASDAPALEPAAVHVHAAAASRRALVVEDEAPIRQLVVRLLERRGYAVVEAESRASARDAVRDGAFDVVLCDLRLADGSGTGVVDDIRAMRPDITRRVIFVTGDASSLADAEPDVADLPVLPKPFTSADLDRALSSLMASA
ncbi:MAG TPA: ATP-binding protein [Vicinamibacterales bacterium]|nr:ATP-binding protein [Vicinamibacterales bacterium]